jgi:hypothetical protein
VDFNEYRKIGAVNWSSLKMLRDSALHYRHYLETPFKATPAMALGRVAHMLVFEPDQFAAEYVIWEGGDRRGKEWLAFRDAHAGKTIFKPAEIDVAVQIADAVKRHPLVQPYLQDGVFEQSIRWVDEDTGLICKGRPDWLQEKRRTLVDLKTTITADARRFGAQAARLGYHCQLAMYRDGIETALGWKPEKVCIIAVENEPPHDVGVFQVDEDTLYLARDEVKQLMLQLVACRASDSWPGRYVEEQALYLPAWVYGSDDESDPETFGLTLQEQ